MPGIGGGGGAGAGGSAAPVRSTRAARTARPAIASAVLLDLCQSLTAASGGRCTAILQEREVRRTAALTPDPSPGPPPAPPGEGSRASHHREWLRGGGRWVPPPWEGGGWIRGEARRGATRAWLPFLSSSSRVEEPGSEPPPHFG